MAFSGDYLGEDPSCFLRTLKRSPGTSRSRRVAEPEPAAKRPGGLSNIHSMPPVHHASPSETFHSTIP